MELPQGCSILDGKGGHGIARKRIQIRRAAVGMYLNRIKTKPHKNIKVRRLGVVFLFSFFFFFFFFFFFDETSLFSQLNDSLAMMCSTPCTDTIPSITGL